MLLMRIINMSLLKQIEMNNTSFSFLKRMIFTTTGMMEKLFLLRIESSSKDHEAIG